MPVVQPNVGLMAITVSPPAAGDRLLALPSDRPTRL
jgi:hypothetical protein